MTIIICICQFKYIICSCLPKRLTLWCVIRDECIIVRIHPFCINDRMSDFCSGCLAVCHFLNLVATIPLQMPEKYVPRIFAYLSMMYDKMS